MDFSLTPDQESIREAVLKICSQFTDDYWLERDREGVFPHEFHKTMAEAGWLGVAMPESVGGAGLGITEAAIMMQAVAESGGGMTAASSIHGPVFSMQPVALLRHFTFAYVPPMQTSAFSLSRQVPLLASQLPPSFGLLQETTNSATTASDARREVMGSPERNVRKTAGDCEQRFSTARAP